MSNLPAIKELAGSPAIQKRVAGLVENSSAFINTVVSLVGSDSYLQNCDPQTVWGAALKAAALNLPINKELGQAYIIPYGKNATFIIGYKGLIQLAIRTGQYRTIKAVEIYEDEIKHYNPITEEFQFGSFNQFGDREDPEKHPVGYYAFFELLNGYRATKYMSRAAIERHAARFSKTYNTKNSVWKTDFDAMAKKTVLRLLLTQQGLLSIDVMQAEVEAEQAAEQEANVIETVEAPAPKEEKKEVAENKQENNNEETQQDITIPF